ncbi:LysR family transcriptional regulator [Vibrio cholerae]|jgi:DNA-binding transcriptional LysR family regulator|uniref:LysR family transcriptional regulator n=1 Tax=Vibrio TaxID=662 RepID=UPI0015CF4976|nr:MULTISPECIES: LysR family transcriptional regulator [Vibrio]MCG6231749.1 LysR family transcriptional regulator [Vibrio furnissii]MCG6258837.1 LysR family transcriptional regulator [Vibrio furnissii]MCO7013396.1 LysR family transcriptional regulator [Vibrio paracholerae]MCO7033557.1 LysR family transcriptional regulator [Vibrio paracholerae]MCO7046918.1 LysR family transcriptional regulator [Vibrio paracholerae]
MLDKIVYFLHVVRTGSFSLAAKQHGISASAGSRWIIELEESMGISLLKRSTRKVVPTQAGLRLYERFDRINGEIDEIVTEIQNLGNDDRGVIRIASTPLFAKYFLGTIVGEYLQQHPHVTFRILETAFDMDHIDEIDFAIRASALYQGFQEKDSLLVKRSLLKYPLMACCSPKYIAKYGEPELPEDLRRHNCLYASTLVGGNKWVFERDGEMATVDIAQTVEVEDSQFIKTVAMNGGGIGYLPVRLIEEELKQESLVPILREYTNSEFEFSLYYRPRRQMPVRCVNFKDYLIKRVREISETE